MAISHDAHTVKQFDVQLANLRNLVLEMGGLGRGSDQECASRPWMTRI
jgi:hypothetical protein